MTTTSFHFSALRTLCAALIATVLLPRLNLRPLRIARTHVPPVYPFLPHKIQFPRMLLRAQQKTPTRSHSQPKPPLVLLCPLRLCRQRVLHWVPSPQSRSHPLYKRATTPPWPNRIAFLPSWNPLP
ncbi:hypothetical protein EDB85DRAFT_1180349 [Lactarius pseudohatsudake]|nr:hypothetical protein EDB85DRAFT_1180349 [Lactarius pseudohatsudake]